MMPVSTQSTSPATSWRSVLSSGQAMSPCTVHGRSDRWSGITCQIGSSTLASAPSSKTRCRNVAVRSVWRAPGTSWDWTSAMACSVIHSTWRRQASSSGVLTSRAALMTSLAARGGHSAKSTSRSWCIAPVTSS